jgi:NAD-dependent deacetylase
VTPGALDRATAILAAARTLLVTTGAGMSRESGIPTFRDAQEGLWARFDPHELATEAGFRAAPARVWGWYAHRRSRILSCEPHAGHRAVVGLERLVPEVVVVTQNIDGLHQAAGSGDVVELHGSIRRFKCLDGHHPFEGEPPAVQEPPPCPRCASPLRPDVVWFGEVLPPAATERAWRLARECDALLVVGTSGVVWPAAELPWIARGAGRPVVEVNPEPSEVTPCADVFLHGTAGTVLPELLRRLEEHGELPTSLSNRRDDA